MYIFLYLKKNFELKKLTLTKSTFSIQISILKKHFFSLCFSFSFISNATYKKLFKNISYYFQQLNKQCEMDVKNQIKNPNDFNSLELF